MRSRNDPISSSQRCCDLQEASSHCRDGEWSDGIEVACSVSQRLPGTKDQGLSNPQSCPLKPCGKQLEQEVDERYGWCSSAKTCQPNDSEVAGGWRSESTLMLAAWDWRRGGGGRAGTDTGTQEELVAGRGGAGSTEEFA